MGCQNNKGVKLLHTNTQRLMSTVLSAFGRGRRVAPFFCSQDEDAEHLVSPSRSRSLYRRKSCPTNAQPQGRPSQTIIAGYALLRELTIIPPAQANKVLCLAVHHRHPTFGAISARHTPCFPADMMAESARDVIFKEGNSAFVEQITNSTIFTTSFQTSCIIQKCLQARLSL
jgi:hypothetical protein